MSEHPNAALLRRIYSGEADAVYGALAPEYVAHVPAAAIEGDYAGANGHRAHREAIMRLTNGTLRKLQLDAFLANDEWGIVPFTLTAERDGQTLNVQAFGIWRFRDGKIAEHWAMVADQRAFDAFFR